MVDERMVDERMVDKNEYDTRLAAVWLEGQVAAEQRMPQTRWLAATAVAIAAGGAIIFLARRQFEMGRALKEKSRERATELAQLGAGLAHEIRNPLHALRINLHTLRRVWGGRSSLPEEQIVATIEESDAAIDRLDALMRDLLQFSDPSVGEVAEVDVVHELRATLELLAEDWCRQRIEVRSQLPQEPVPVSIDPVRLRQSLLNVLTFAQHRAGKSGTIHVDVERRGCGVEIAVADSGPQLPEDQRKRLFKPFQAPAETGSGLGLALVQVFVEEVGGRASWDTTSAARNRCRLWFPLAPGPKGGQI